MPPGPQNSATTFLFTMRTPSSSSRPNLSSAPPVTARPSALPRPADPAVRFNAPCPDRGGVEKPLDAPPFPTIIARLHTHARAVIRRAPANNPKRAGGGVDNPCYSPVMRITIKPPSPTPPALTPGALLTVRVETADPRPLLAGPPSIAYEGRYTADPAPGAFLFPAPGDGREKEGVSTAPPAASDFRTPPPAPSQDHVDIPVREGDVVTATLVTPTKTYSAAMRAGGGGDAPVVLQLAEGGAATPQPPTPQPQPAPGLTITPDQDEDVLTLDPAPGNDNIVVVN